MTQAEFEDITTYYELEKCARDYGYFDQVFPDGLYTRDEFESRVLDDAKYCDSLSELRSLVDDIPSDRYDRYIHDDYDGTWRGTDDNDATFDEYKDDLKSYMDDNQEWEDEPEEKDEPEEEEEPAAEGEAATDIMDIIHEIVDNYEIPEEEPEPETPALTEEQESEFAEELMKAFEEYCTTEVQIKEEPEEEKVNLEELFVEAC